MNEEKKETTSKEIKTETEEILQIIKRNQNTRISTGQRTDKIFEAYKNWKGHETKLTNVTEPIMLFGRRNGTFELYEGVTQGTWTFKHSSGEERFIIIDPNTMCRIGIGRNSIRAYWAHEDHPVTGWPSPITTGEQVNTFADKLMADVKNWLLKKADIDNKRWLYIAAAVALVLIAFGLYKGMVPPPTSNTVIIQGANAMNETIKNMTHAALNGSALI